MGLYERIVGHERKDGCRLGTNTAALYNHIFIPHILSAMYSWIAVFLQPFLFSKSWLLYNSPYLFRL